MPFELHTLSPSTTCPRPLELKKVGLVFMSLTVGLVDSLLLLCLGAGHFLHALYPVEKPVKTLWIGMFGCAISYALIPFCIDSHLNNLTALSILMSINGFLQSYTWPNLLMIVKQKWDQKKNPAAMGFWPTNTNIGNIVGYLICTEFVMALNFPW